jgi:hypothetical protein
MIRINIHCARPIFTDSSVTTVQYERHRYIVPTEVGQSLRAAQKRCPEPAGRGTLPLYISLCPETGALSCSANSPVLKHCSIVNRLPRIDLDSCLENYSICGLRKSSKLQKLYEEVYVGEVWLQRRTVMEGEFRCLRGCSKPI